MADADEGLTGFLREQDGEDNTFKVNGTEYTTVQAANPVNWSKLAQAIALSAIGTLSIALQGIVDRTGKAVTDVIGALGSFVGDVSVDGDLSGSGVLGNLFLPILQWYRQDLWASSVDQFGLWGYPVAVGFTLLTLFVAVAGLQQAGDRLTGGS
jgi:hypothetical protein